MQFPILYHQARTGKIHSWKIWTEENIIYQEYGTIDGAKTGTHKQTEAKNIGKSNETTPASQAELEAKAMWKKKLDMKYSETQEQAQQVVWLPMLAHDLKKTKKPLPYPVDVQTKLDGSRSMAFWDGEEVVLMSRGGKYWDVPHIKKALEQCLPKDYVADGEFYVHAMPLQDIMHLAKSPNCVGQEKIVYNIFDGFIEGETSTPWSQRKELLNNWFSAIKDATYLNLVQTESCSSDGQLKEYLYKYEQAGFEGVIVRVLDGVYELGHRSRKLWKLKSFQDKEFKIVGYSQANGNDLGTIIFECENEQGTRFGVRPKGTREQRAEWFKNGDKFINKWLTVKFQARY